MFDYLSGHVSRIAPNLAVIDCGGVGFACKTTAQTIAVLRAGDKGKLYTYMHIREDIMELYGFASEEERSCFQMLIGVSGVGPRAAISILSATTPEGLALSVITNDEKILTVAPGIGKKTAQRIILELKDKLPKDGISIETVGAPVTGNSMGNKANEAAAALAVLGYGNEEISAALKGLDIEEQSLEEVIRQALRSMIK